MLSLIFRIILTAFYIKIKINFVAVIILALLRPYLGMVFISWGCFLHLVSVLSSAVIIMVYWCTVFIWSVKNLLGQWFTTTTYCRNWIRFMPVFKTWVIPWISSYSWNKKWQRFGNTKSQVILEITRPKLSLALSVGKTQNKLETRKMTTTMTICGIGWVIHGLIVPNR